MATTRPMRSASAQSSPRASRADPPLDAAMQMTSAHAPSPPALAHATDALAPKMPAASSRRASPAFPSPAHPPERHSN